MIDWKMIYFDLDGVLVSFNSHLAELEGRSMDEVIAERVDGKTVQERFMDCLRKHIHKEPFIHAPAHLDMLEYVMDNAMEWEPIGIKVGILSSGSAEPDLYHEIRRQKLQWLRNHGLHELLEPIHIVNGARNKSQFAAPGVILIDDYEKNCTRFRDAGGVAIHHTSYQETLKQMLQFGL